ncbi:beae6018-91b1-46fd-9b6b-421393eecdf6 [Thermothielavioides terrestris]|uniref:Beae6018-91b1-46fd-9b6b-421393eecdf6 n=1 Tax=Thermothielavioides terrestris TaxID=2587410 RepID=A0A446BEZ5_9PEZI|nr:beae6018-91b1-46fd-9b6b-421393eecdf6 [Thermothielavioides terrestris]
MVNHDPLRVVGDKGFESSSPWPDFIALDSDDDCQSLRQPRCHHLGPISRGNQVDSTEGRPKMETSLECRDGKMFIGGLNWETTDQSLRDYFSQFGEVVECTVMRDGATGRSRGFGFLTFKDPKTVNIVMVKEHYLDGKIIDPKRAIPRDEQEKTSKIFVGGVSQETTDHEFREYFAQFGRVVDATLMMDKDTGRPRGFGFVTFESEAGVEACLAAKLEIHGKPIEVKKAQPRGNLRDDDDAARRGGKFGRKGQGMGGMGGMDDGGHGGGAGMGGMGAASTAGMSPQLMAQYIQRMQQAFAMMQQQMMMNRNMNPAMFQMMYMQQMQQMQNMMAAQQGRGGPGPMANMNPALMQQQMQQMQQMQQQMMNQQGGGPGGPGMNQGGMSPGGGGNQGPGAGPGGGGAGPNRAGYNAYDQQQQQFEQQKYDQQQQQQPGPGRRGGRGDMQHQQGGYGQGGYMGGGGGPTSWEGMYDDVPQPIMNQGGGGGGGGFGGGRGGGFHKGGRGGGQQQPPQGPVDPANAPPANAPTGPKNAGRPGANYRGGGRGGNRGFHPYARS